MSLFDPPEDQLATFDLPVETGLDPSAKPLTTSEPPLGTAFDPREFSLAMAQVPTGAGLGLNLGQPTLGSQFHQSKPNVLTSNVATGTMLSTNSEPSSSSELQLGSQFDPQEFTLVADKLPAGAGWGLDLEPHPAFAQRPSSDFDQQHFHLESSRDVVGWNPGIGQSPTRMNSSVNGTAEKTVFEYLAGSGSFPEEKALSAADIFGKEAGDIHVDSLVGFGAAHPKLNVAGNDTASQAILLGQLMAQGYRGVNYGPGYVGKDGLRHATFCLSCHDPNDPSAFINYNAAKTTAWSDPHTWELLAASALVDPLIAEEGIFPAVSPLRQEAAPASRLFRLLYDDRPFPKISKEYWQTNGPAEGRSLHHWLIPQRADWVPQGVRNAGYNLMEIPRIESFMHPYKGFNQWMGMTRSPWGPAADWGIRVGVPAALGAGIAGGIELGNVMFKDKP